MNARFIIIRGIPTQNPAQVRLPEYDHMVETFPSDRADQPLDWRRTRISATSFVLGLKNEAMIWRISRRDSIIKWQGYRVSASRLAESNFRYTQALDEACAFIPA